MSADPETFGRELAAHVVAEIQAAALTIAEAGAKTERLAEIVPRAHASITAASAAMIEDGAAFTEAEAWALAAHASFLTAMEIERANITTGGATPPSKAA